VSDGGRWAFVHGVVEGYCPQFTPDLLNLSGKISHLLRNPQQQFIGVISLSGL
jgi:hypothetical protein